MTFDLANFVGIDKAAVEFLSSRTANCRVALKMTHQFELNAQEAENLFSSMENCKVLDTLEYNVVSEYLIPHMNPLLWSNSLRKLSLDIQSEIKQLGGQEFVCLAARGEIE